MKVGDRVRVRTSVIVYHHPEYRNRPFDLKGMEGELKAVLRDWNGRPISANFPFQVQFGNKFRAHLQADELEVVESAGSGKSAETAA
jgi:hypothetical protein